MASWRRAPLLKTDRIENPHQNPHVNYRQCILQYGDMTDSMNLTRIMRKVQPDENYNLAAQGQVVESFEEAEYIASSDGIGTPRKLLDLGLLRKLDWLSRPPGPEGLVASHAKHLLAQA